MAIKLILTVPNQTAYELSSSNAKANQIINDWLDSRNVDTSGMSTSEIMEAFMQEIKNELVKVHRSKSRERALENAVYVDWED